MKSEHKDTATLLSQSQIRLQSLIREAEAIAEAISMIQFQENELNRRPIYTYQVDKKECDKHDEQAKALFKALGWESK